MSSQRVQTPVDPQESLHTLFRARVSEGLLKQDPAQMLALGVLDDCIERLNGYRPPQQSLIERWLGTEKKNPLPLGLYLYGKVGRGKSMLMDMFFSAVNVQRKRRVHFHQFMLEIHERLHKMQSERVDDILPEVAEAIANETWLLCFDEFHVSNIADAMILGRLFTSLFDAGVFIVVTSNWPPDELYKNGLQRDRFLPFIETLKSHMLVHNLEGGVDHRYEQTRDLKSYFTPLGEETTRKLQGIFFQLTHDAPPEIIELPVQGRRLKIVHAAHGVGFFNFDELCRKPLAASDYLAIAACLHTVILDEVPKFKPDARDETLRFMTLIDTLYEAKVKLYMGAAVAADILCLAGEHAFAFQRTVSRLMEMQSSDYRKKPHLEEQ